MVTEWDKTRDALQTAIQMEIDGKEFYLKASQGSSNELGRKLLKTLAAEEDVHREKFQEIYEAIQRKKAWPLTDFRPDGGKRLRTIFARATQEISSKVKPLTTELDAVKTALGMESKSYDFYKSRVKDAAYDAEKDFYDMVAAEEWEHHLVLLDYFEYLKDPASWFVSKEHPSLDGG